MIDGLTNSGAMPALERMIQFTAQRQGLLAHDIANLSTPGFRPVDMSVGGFQEQLGQEIDERRAGLAATRAGADGRPSQADGGRGMPEASPIAANVLFHDGNDRNVENIMQKMVENFLAFRTASQLYKNHHDLLSAAIRERI